MGLNIMLSWGLLKKSGDCGCFQCGLKAVDPTPHEVSIGFHYSVKRICRELLIAEGLLIFSL